MSTAAINRMMKDLPARRKIGKFHRILNFNREIRESNFGKWRNWTIEIFYTTLIYLEIKTHEINAELSAVKKQKQENKK